MKSVQGMFRLLLVIFVICGISFGVSAHSLCNSFQKHEIAGFKNEKGTDVHEQSSTDCQSAIYNPLSVSLSVLVTPGIAHLTWITTDIVSEGNYVIERQVFGTGTWTQIGQLPYNAQLVYNDTISFPYCTATDFLYRVRLISVLLGDIPSNSEPANQLSDLTNPADVNNTVVSFTNSVYPVLTWSQVPGTDIAGYIISRLNGVVWDSIAYVQYGGGNIFIDNTAPDVCGAFKYIILGLDQCGRRSAPVYEDVFVQSIELNVSAIDECERLAKMSWNSYTSMPGGLGGYKVFRVIDNGAPSVIHDSNDTTFVDSYNFSNGHLYAYYVKAYSSGGTFSSSSCQEQRTFTGPDVPDSIYITNVSVVNDSYVKLNYHISPGNTVKKLVLERSSDGGTSFNAIDSLSVTSGFVQDDYFFNDTTADVHSLSYTYRLAALDNCAIRRSSFYTARSILSQCSYTTTENVLEWNSYETWLKGINGYDIYRQIDGLPAEGELISTVSGAADIFRETSAVFNSNAKICYWVVAHENSGNPYFSDASSVSNICCIDKDATVFMPTAFSPGGKNRRFRPVASFIDPLSFKMIIFDRWGRQIFETDNMVFGWDGSIDGEIAPSGLYAYKIFYSSIEGKDYSKRGTVYLVK